MTIVQMSVSGAVLIAVILLLRRGLLHRLPKWTFLLLWAVALCRLLLPFQAPSPVSIYTGAAWVSEAVQRAAPPAVTPEEPVSAVQPPIILPEHPQKDAGTADAPAFTASAPKAAAVSPLWAVYGTGVALCALFFAAAYWRGLRRFRTAVLAEGDFLLRWQKEHPTLFPVRIKTGGGVSAPLVYGLLRPVVLLPQDTDWSDEERLTYILTHEYVHIRRGDMLWKLLLTAALCVHWCNPLVWAMYFCANRDLELACDEAVLRILGPDSRKGYAYTLLSAEEVRFFPLCSTYRSKSSLEERITAIMKTAKRPVWVLLAALLLVAGVAAVFATSRVIPTSDSMTGSLTRTNGEKLQSEEPVTRVSEPPEGVWMEVVKDSVTSSGLEYIVHNENKGRRLTYGEKFSLQAERGGEWYDLTADPPENFAFLSIGYELDGEIITEQSHALNWTLLYGELSPGHYRMLKPAIWAGKTMEPVLALEFEIQASPIVPDNIEGVWMEAVEGTVTPSGLEYMVHNETGRELLYGEPYFLQVKKNGVWNAVELADGNENMAFILIGYVLDGVEQTSESRTVTWSYAYGELPPGHYRMIKSMKLGPAREPLSLSAEFEFG